MSGANGGTASLAVCALIAAYAGGKAVVDDSSARTAVAELTAD